MNRGQWKTFPGNTAIHSSSRLELEFTATCKGFCLTCKSNPLTPLLNTKTQVQPAVLDTFERNACKPTCTKFAAYLWGALIEYDYSNPPHFIILKYGDWEMATKGLDWNDIEVSPRTCFAGMHSKKNKLVVPRKILVGWDWTTSYLKTVSSASKVKTLWQREGGRKKEKKKEYNLVDLVDGKLTKITISLLDALPEDKMN